MEKQLGFIQRYYRVDNKYGIFSGNALTYTQLGKLKMDIVYTILKGCTLFVLHNVIKIHAEYSIACV